MTDIMRDEPGAPEVVDRSTFQAELEALRGRETRSISSAGAPTCMRSGTLGAERRISGFSSTSERFHRLTAPPTERTALRPFGTATCWRARCQSCTIPGA